MEGAAPSRPLHLGSLGELAGCVGQQSWDLGQQAQLRDKMCMRLIREGVAEQFVRWVGVGRAGVVH